MDCRMETREVLWQDTASGTTGSRKWTVLIVGRCIIPVVPTGPNNCVLGPGNNMVLLSVLYWPMGWRMAESWVYIGWCTACEHVLIWCHTLLTLHLPIYIGKDYSDYWESLLLMINNDRTNTGSDLAAGVPISKVSTANLHSVWKYINLSNLHNNFVPKK